jgi:hypothetical protein
MRKKSHLPSFGMLLRVQVDGQDEFSLSSRISGFLLSGGHSEASHHIFRPLLSLIFLLFFIIDGTSLASFCFDDPPKSGPEYNGFN